MISRKRGSGARAISASTAVVTSSWLLMIIAPFLHVASVDLSYHGKHGERAGTPLESAVKSGHTRASSASEDSRGHRHPREDRPRPRQGRRPRRHGGAQRRGGPAQ